MEEKTPVIIVPYDPKWVDLYRVEAAHIQDAIGEYIIAIEHIGSTSVPGLAAKPIIDILIGLKGLADTPLFVPPLEKIGFVYKPENEVDFPERRYLHKKKPGQLIVHLHMVEPNTEFFKRHLAFRDYLRAHPESAAEYAALKTALAAKFGNDREGYTDAKTDFIKGIERKAMQSK